MYEGFRCGKQSCPFSTGTPALSSRKWVFQTLIEMLQGLNYKPVKGQAPDYDSYLSQEQINRQVSLYSHSEVPFGVECGAHLRRRLGSKTRSGRSFNLPTQAWAKPSADVAVPKSTGSSSASANRSTKIERITLMLFAGPFQCPQFDACRGLQKLAGAFEDLYDWGTDFVQGADPAMRVQLDETLRRNLALRRAYKKDSKGWKHG